ncbi:alpha/beta hydrolase family protein [Croceitalea marina]|uniref:Alpha/beta hydrolase family protein n=1 Tax=Croceitalea marina TaxID=1775166 RepID=A0ABW5MZL6_9FLAO
MSCKPKTVNQEITTKGITYTLGTKQFIWLDSLRTDSYYGENRLVNAQIWYPSTISNEKSDLTPYFYNISLAYPHLKYWSKNDFDLVNAVKTKSFLNTAIKDWPKAYPLIIFSPSLGGNLSQYTYYAQYLAERGFIVMGINHLYESEYVINQKDKIIVANLTFHDSLKTLKIPEQITANNYRSVKAIRQQVLGEDLIFALNKILEEPFFENRINTHQIGVFGHSIGGAASIYASMLDDRIKAVVDIDGTPPTLALENGINAPFMFIEDLTDYENHEGYKKLHKRRNDFCELNKKDSWRILLVDTNHNSFLDSNYYLAQDGVQKKNSKKLLDKTSEYMSRFFEHLFFSETLNVEPIKTDSLEIILFKK